MALLVRFKNVNILGIVTGKKKGELFEVRLPDGSMNFYLDTKFVTIVSLSEGEQLQPFNEIIQAYLPQIVALFFNEFDKIRADLESLKGRFLRIKKALADIASIADNADI